MNGYVGLQQNTTRAWSSSTAFYAAITDRWQFGELLNQDLAGERLVLFVDGYGQEWARLETRIY